MRYNYAVVLYQPSKYGPITEANPDKASIYYGDTLKELKKAVLDYIEAFDLKQSDFKGGQVFACSDLTKLVGQISYNGEYVMK